MKEHLGSARAGKADEATRLGVRQEHEPETRWQMQTKRGGGHAPPEERGDCVPACIASILGVPISEIKNCHGEGWWQGYQQEVGRYGMTLAMLDIRWWIPPAYWIASVPSLNLPAEPDGREALHTVVARGDELIHDPCLDGRYDEAAWTEAWNAEKVVEGWILLPLDPASGSGPVTEGGQEK